MAAPSLERIPGGLTVLALSAGLRRQIRQEWAGSPMHRFALANPKPEGLAAAPHDLRPADIENGRRVAMGSFVFAGASLHPGPRGDPWDRPSPNRRFAIALHRFGWLRDVVALGEAGSAEGLRLVLEWRRVFGRWNSFSWSPEVLERRTFNLACAIHPICAPASEAETEQIASDLARQGRHLLEIEGEPARAAERAAVAAVAGTALSGEAGEKLIDHGLVALEKALPVTVAADGGHASRSPAAALELLLDLRTLDEALVQRGIAAPEEMMRAIDRLAGAVRFFTLAGGGLPAFQGGEETAAATVRAGHAADEAAGRPIPASRNGYHRMDSRSLQVIADGAPPASGPWSVAACAQPLAMEVTAGGRPLIVSCGWSPDAAGPQALRVADAGSTLTVADAVCGEPLRGFRAGALGPWLVGAYEKVEAKRHETEGALWLELAHDGWAPQFGLRHERRLYLDTGADELRGEDALTPTGQPRGEASRRFVPYMIRFHLHPDVRASVARDGKSVLIRAGEDEPGWWLRNDAQEVSIEGSVHFQEGQPRRTSQVVLRGQCRLDAGARMRWKLAAAEAWPPPR
jgi:uncharacterized heparinase superfamily protein